VTLNSHSGGSFACVHVLLGWLNKQLVAYNYFQSFQNTARNQCYGVLLKLCLYDFLPA